ncbi:acyl-CoA carboxylase subunit beta [Alcaligenes phenolicus]|uniref:Methylcrotonoyl-CoA carboxylase n=1 Tax=Alcaligenes phenolicus TaxID=232846 RepID=A0AAW5VTT0_9BURK|nr:carboxyl transferase domain-containing protein [Alcaligenes phenolicus]MCX5564283.1 methylcrotonoyl-CoA carboxylase [Alcaligenes phenolicus]
MNIIDTRVNRSSDTFQTNVARYTQLLENLRARRLEVMNGGGEAMMRRHRERGKIPVWERINKLLDPFSPFLELSGLAAWGQYDNEVPAAGIITGIGMVSGRPCMLICNDATVKGGSFFRETVKKHVRAQEIAEENGLPVLYLVDCGGAFLPQQDEVFPDKDHFGNTFFRQCRMSAKGIPQISAVFGGCTAGGAYIPALSDEVVIVRGTGRIHLGGPPIVKAAVNEIVDGETLGGADMHVHVSGVADYLAENEAAALLRLRHIVAGFPARPSASNTVREPEEPLYDSEDLLGIVSTDLKQPYDVREVIARLVDGSRFQEFKPDFGSSLVCGFAHCMGYPVGIIANNGVLFSDSSVKGAHFIELCNQRNIPILFLQNISGFMVGTDAERGGIARHSAKLVYAMATARVPRYTVIIGGSYGAGNYGMCGRGFNPRFLFSWPSSRIATMSSEVATTVLTDLRKSSLKKAPTQAELDQLAEETTRQFTEQSDPYYATSRLWDDGIIEPTDTRRVLGLCLALSATQPQEQAQSPVYRM